KIDKTNSPPLFCFLHNGRCRRGTLRYKGALNCRRLLQCLLYSIFYCVDFYPQLVFAHLFLPAALANDGFQVEVNDSLPSFVRQIQSIHEIAYAWSRVVVQIPSLCPESSFLSTISPHHFVN